jgi:uncharacterized SAM-binding protein YcdF (DUF218 family)
VFWLLTFAVTIGITLARRRRTLEARWRWIGWVLVVTSLAAAVAIAPSWVGLRKSVAFLLMPPTVLWIALVALAIRSRREPRWRWPLLSVLLAYSAAGSPITSYLLMRGLERPFESIFPLRETASYDALFVMGGGSSSRRDDDGVGEPQFGESGDRLRLAAAVHEQGRAAILVTSGSSIDGSRDMSAETATLWEETGIPPEAVLRLPAPRNSAAEVAAYARLVEERGWSRIGLITSARHLPRALALCRRHGLRVDPLPSDFRAIRPRWDLPALVPTGDGFASVEAAVWEYVGLAAVRLLGG